MGIPATGRKIRFDVHSRGRFVDGKMAERWDQVDYADIKLWSPNRYAGITRISFYLT